MNTSQARGYENSSAELCNLNEVVEKSDVSLSSLLSFHMVMKLDAK